MLGLLVSHGKFQLDTSKYYRDLDKNVFWWYGQIMHRKLDVHCTSYLSIKLNQFVAMDLVNFTNLKREQLANDRSR